MAKLVQGAGSLRKRIREETEGVGAAEDAAADEVPTLTGEDTAGPKKKKAKTAAGPNAGKKGSNKKKPNVTKKEDGDDVDNVVYLGHVPNGFFEAEIRNFFSQFGSVRRIKLFRSKKTGNPKGYAFVQFGSMDVATVAAEAMDGYMFGDRKLVAHVVDKSKCHEGMFLPYKVKVVPEKKEKSEETEEQAVARQYTKVLRSDKKKMDRIKSAGIEF